MASLLKIQSALIIDMKNIASSRVHPLQLSPMTTNDHPQDQFYPHSATVQLNAVFGRDMNSPRQPYPSHSGPKGPIPRFKILKTAQDIEPRIHVQPAFRRADPEGGFISVGFAMRQYVTS